MSGSGRRPVKRLIDVYEPGEGKAQIDAIVGFVIGSGITECMWGEW